MTPILKLLLSVTTISVCVYGVNIFGFSLWPILFSTLSVFLLFSIYFTSLNKAAVIVSKIIGVLSLLAFALLLLASTIGGSSHMSESNQIIAIALALMALFGCAFFLIGSGNAKRKQA